MAEKKTNAAVKIKYDRRQIKAYSIVLYIVGFIFAVSLWLLHTDDHFWGNGWFADILGLVIFLGLSIGGIFFILLAYVLLDGVLYLKRLKAHGYEIPTDKRQYGGMLEQLPRRKDNSSALQDKSAKNILSRAMMWSSVVIGLAMLGLTIWYYCKWQFMGDDANFMFVVQLVTDVLWLSPVRSFYKQMDNRKYKDDVEIDSERKNRMQLLDGLILFFVLGGMCVVVKGTAHNMSAYVYSDWMNRDEDVILDIHNAFEIIYTDPYLSNDDSNWKETMAALETGVDITTWGVPEGAYQEKVAKAIEVVDFSELKNSFKSTDGPASVYVKMVNGDFAVELLNLHEVANRVIRIE